MPNKLNDEPSVEGEDLDCFNETTLIEMLNARAATFADRAAFKFYEDDQQSRTVTYAQLDATAKRIAVGLRRQIPRGAGIALVFPPGLAFIENFFGCLYAGLVPIPATYPKPRRPSPRLSAIVADAQPAAILTTERVYETCGQIQTPDNLHKRLWLTSESFEDEDAALWQHPQTTVEDIAFLQYTSGSTKEPRGVAVSHENISCNLEMIRLGFDLDVNKHAIGVSWLPAYHDMGLIGGILESLYVGGTTILMSPLSFLQRPARWLRAISDHRAVISGGPNFAYELCLRKIKPEELDGLDLSTWQVAFSGAEPIRATTLRKFAEKFAPYGFSDSAYYPCYGLAEATLLVTGGLGPGNISTCKVLASSLQDGGEIVSVGTEKSEQNCLEFVGCGGPLLGEEVRIVDPESCKPLGDNQVGEIWIRGRNVARGYFNTPLSDDSAFAGRLADLGRCGEAYCAQDTNAQEADTSVSERTYLRTGDLGFLRNGSLYVTGRKKELLIIRGRNHYPHDIEATVQLVHDKLIPGGGAAFTIDADDESTLVIVQEVDRSTTASDHEEMLKEIRRAVTTEHDVFVHEVILIRMGSLPRTTSGKVRYAEVRRQYLEKDFSVVARWSTAEKPATAETNRVEVRTSVIDVRRLQSLAEGADQEKLALEIQENLMEWLRQTVDSDENELEPGRPLAEIGLDSMAAMELIGHLEGGLGLKLSPTVAWTYPTPAALAGYLAQQMTKQEDTEVEQAFAEASQDDLDELLSQLEELSEEDAAVMLAAEELPERPE